MSAPALSWWNWKSAVLSAGIRASNFFAANLRAGRAAAWAAFWTEILLRLTTSGFYGGLIQACGRLEPEWKGLLIAVVTLPLASHGVELPVHLWRGTPGVALSITASVVFTIISTVFNVYAMRRGAFTTGTGSQSLLADVRQTPRLVLACVRAAIRFARLAVAAGLFATDSRRSC